MKNKMGKVIAVTAAVAATGVVLKKMRDARKQQEASRIQSIEAALMSSRDYGGRKAYLAGGGLAAMAAAAYLVRDCRFPADQITIYGGSDSLGDPETGFVCPWGSMLNEKTCENFWELFGTVASIRQPGISVTEEIFNFNRSHPAWAGVRLADRDGGILNEKNRGFVKADRMALLKLMAADEKKLDNLTIQDWFRETPHFFTTGFWSMFQAAYAFQKWSSLYEFRRYMNRMIFAFGLTGSLERAARTPLNYYDSVLRPLEAHLRSAGVNFAENCRVTDIDFAETEGITAKTLYLRKENPSPQEGAAPYFHEIVTLNDGDICIIDPACMAGSHTRGDLHTAAPLPVKPTSGGLWAKAAAGKPELGNPEPFFGRPQETNLLSFTVTCRGDLLLKAIEKFTGNVPGSGAILTFRDSSWLMSSVAAAQPQFMNQPSDQTVFQGFGLYTEAVGDYVKKPMRDCTGQELLNEYLHHLHIQEDQIAELMKTVINVIPCYMPYANARFEPRKYTDRPQVVPAGSVNFAVAGPFAEIPGDTVFTGEYSVRSARTAVYTLMDVKLPICPVTPYNRSARTLLKALKKVYM